VQPRCDRDVHVKSVSDLARVLQDVRTGVLEFVQSVRSAASNPLDFLSQQTVDNRFKYLVTVVKNVVSAVESVSIDSHKAPSSTESRSSTIDRSSASAASAAAAASGAAKNNNAVTQATIRKIQTAMAALDKAAFDVASHERTQAVNSNAKLTVQGLYRLMEQASESADTDEVGGELKRCAVQLVNATKGMMKDAIDPHHQQQFKQAVRQIEEALQQFYLAVAQPTSSRSNADDIDKLQRPSRPAPQVELSYAIPPPIAAVAAGGAKVVVLPPPPLPPMEDITDLTPPEPPSVAVIPPPIRVAASNTSSISSSSNNRTMTPPASSNNGRGSPSVSALPPGARVSASTLSPSLSASASAMRPRALSNAVPSPSLAASASAAVPSAKPSTPQRPTSYESSLATEFVGERKKLAALVSDVLVVLRKEVPELKDAWKALPSERRLALLNLCVDAAQKRSESADFNEHDATGSDSGTLKSSSSSSSVGASPRHAADEPGSRATTVIDDQQLRELSRMMGLQETSDFGQIKVALERSASSSRSATDVAQQLAALDGDVAKRIGALGAHCERTLLAVFESASACFVEKTRVPALTERIETAHVVLSKVALVLAEPSTYGTLQGEEQQVTSKVFGSVVAVAQSFATQAPMLAHLVEAATVDATAASFVCEALNERAWHARAHLMAISAQLIGELRLLDEAVRYSIDTKLVPATRHAALQDANRTQLAMQAAATVRGVIDQLSELLGFTETYLYVTAEVAETEQQQQTHFATLRARTYEVVGEPLWGGADADDEGLGSGGERDMMAPAMLNALIRRLTSPTNYDTKFMQTFITTYQSFCEPWVLLNKLIERYHVPPSHKDAMPTIRLRVCIVLKYWIEKQLFDLDVRTTERLRVFIGQVLLRDGQGEMAKRLMSELEQIQTAREAERGSFVELPRLVVPDFDRSPAKLFVQFPSADIAQQMTMIESNMFRRIRPSELLNQAWNRPKLKYRAPHVLEMISRSNKVSRFVASTVLWQRNRAARGAMYGKWLQIADRLRRLNNFNTLMGVVAGLNMSSVNRLRHTIDTLAPKHIELKNALQALVAPTQSFKSYREDLHKVTGACVPYLGVYLTDLTFTEDGNKDVVQKQNERNSKLINIKKRALVHNIISEVQLYQQAAYDFAKTEPLYTLLLEVPNLDEASLYNLSLLREPRGAEAHSIE
jgi:hypothetical protein